MPYTSRYNGPDLTPEERDLKTALRDYTTSGATARDWVPVAALMRTYRTYLAQKQAKQRRSFDPEDTIAPLTIRQLGRAMRRAFPDIGRCTYRHYNGRQIWGYAGLIGPESIDTPSPHVTLANVLPRSLMNRA